MDNLYVRKGRTKKDVFCSAMRYIGGLAVCIIVGIVLLIAVYSLPADRMKANVARSSEVFNYEGIYPQVANGYKYMQLDNFTDSIMLGAAIYAGPEGVIEKAVNNYHIDSEELSPELALTNYANDASYEYYKVGYGRYWHGYLVPLKILLLFFDYSDIRILNFFLQSFLLFFIIKKMYRNRMERYTAAFLAAVFLINPLTAALSLQFSAIYYIMLFSVIYLLDLYERGQIEGKKADHLFFAMGIATAYFDFLTYPLATFGIVVIFYLNINKTNISIHSAKSVLKKFVIWIGGYGGMWSGKWLAGSILTKRNMFTDAVNQVLYRTSLNSEGGGKIQSCGCSC